MDKIPDVNIERQFHNKRFQNESFENKYKVIKKAVLTDYGISYLCPFHSIYQKLTHEHFSDISGKKVLIYGCGTDSSAFWFSKRGAIVDAFDISDMAIDINKEISERLNFDINFFVGDAHNTQLLSNHYDIVFGEAILHHLNLTLAANEINRILKPGGLGFFRDVQQGNIAMKAYRKLTPYRRTPDETPLTDKSLEPFKNNFRNMQTYKFHLIGQGYVFSLRMLILIRSKFGFNSEIRYNSSISLLLEKVGNILFILFPFLQTQAWRIIVLFRK